MNGYIKIKLRKIVCRTCLWDLLFLQGINLKINLEGVDKLQCLRIMPIKILVDLEII